MQHLESRATEFADRPALSLTSPVYAKLYIFLNLENCGFYAGLQCFAFLEPAWLYYTKLNIYSCWIAVLTPETQFKKRTGSNTSKYTWKFCEVCDLCFVVHTSVSLQTLLWQLCSASESMQMRKSRFSQGKYSSKCWRIQFGKIMNCNLWNVTEFVIVVVTIMSLVWFQKWESAISSVFTCNSRLLSSKGLSDGKRSPLKTRNIH